VADTVELYHASANAASREMLMAAQGHVKEYLAGPAAYMAQVYSFVDQQIGVRGG
jgi:hypothetical protein